MITDILIHKIKLKKLFHNLDKLLKWTKLKDIPKWISLLILIKGMILKIWLNNNTKLENWEDKENKSKLTFLIEINFK